jgi:hypothetical protein
MFEMNIIRQQLIVSRRNRFFRRAQRVIVLCLVAGFVLIGNKILELSREVAVVKAQIAKARQTIARAKSAYAIDGIEREWAVFARDVESAALTTGVRSTWGNKLALLAQAIPQGLFLDSVSFEVSSNEAKNRMLTLQNVVSGSDKQGFELSHTFIDALKQTKEFGEDIKVIYDESSSINGQEMEGIQIAAKLP